MDSIDSSDLKGFAEPTQGLLPKDQSKVRSEAMPREKPEERDAASYRELLKSKFKFQKRERSIENLHRDFKGIDVEEARKARLGSHNGSKARDAQSTDAASRKQQVLQHLLEAQPVAGAGEAEERKAEARAIVEEDSNPGQAAEDDKDRGWENSREEQTKSKASDRHAEVVKRETENLNSFKE